MSVRCYAFLAHQNVTINGIYKETDKQGFGDASSRWMDADNEAAYVSCGAAAALTLSTAACITGLDAAMREKLPHLDPSKHAGQTSVTAR